MMTVLHDASNEVSSYAANLKGAPRAVGSVVFRGFGPKREIVDITSALSCSELRLLNVFRQLDALAGQSVAASLLWVRWRMFGDEAELWNAVERLKHRRLIGAGEGRWGISLTDAGFAIMVTL